HRKNLEATRRAADLLRKTIAPSREPAGRAWGQRPSLVRAAATASIPLPESSRNHEREIPRAEPSTRGRSPRSQAAISCKPPTPAAPFRLAEIAGTTSPDVYRPSAPLSPEERRALDRMAERNPDLCHQAPALFGTPYMRGQAG
ncbi:MAG: hypothetical protein ACOYN0_09325, partial [Phycisphaerales bacterium]